MKEINMKRDNAMNQLREEINLVQKRTTARNITAEDVASALEEVEATLSISKKSMDGVRVSVDCNAQSFPSAYKYTPESTQFFARYKSGSWRVYGISRYPVCAPSNRIVVSHTEDSKKALLTRFSNWG